LFPSEDDEHANAADSPAAGEPVDWPWRPERFTSARAWPRLRDARRTRRGQDACAPFLGRQLVGVDVCGTQHMWIHDEDTVRPDRHSPDFPGAFGTAREHRTERR
jgi:hypothetical protein